MMLNQHISFNQILSLMIFAFFARASRDVAQNDIWYMLVLWCHYAMLKPWSRKSKSLSLSNGTDPSSQKMGNTNLCEHQSLYGY